MGQIKSKAQRDSLEAKHCVPLGLYPTCAWPQKTLKKLICDKKLAPIFKGVDEETPGSDLDECPICFLLYPNGLNHARCCRQEICTECFLQLRSTPNNTDTSCPYCNRKDFLVYYSGPKSKAERKSELEDQRKVEEAQKRMREEEIARDKAREAEKLRKAAEEKEKEKEKQESKNEGLAVEIEVPDSYESESSETNIPNIPGIGLQAPPPPPAVNPPNPNPNPPQEAQPVDFQAMIAANEDPDRIEELMMMEAIRLSLLESGGN